MNSLNGLIPRNTRTHTHPVMFLPSLPARDWESQLDKGGRCQASRYIKSLPPGDWGEPIRQVLVWVRRWTEEEPALNPPLGQPFALEMERARKFLRNRGAGFVWRG